MPQSDLRPVAGAGYLTPEAAAAWNAMAAAIAEKGPRIAPNGPDSTYRPYARQVYWRNYWCGQGNCGNAAVPGTSNHGWGLAVDTDDHDLVNANGAPFGWQKAWSDAPSEPWHFRFTSGHFSGSDPGPDYGPTKPPWWKHVGAKIKAARKRRLAKKQRRKATDNAERKSKLHRQIQRLGDLIKRLTKRRTDAK